MITLIGIIMIIFNFLPYIISNRSYSAANGRNSNGYSFIYGTNWHGL